MFNAIISDIKYEYNWKNNNSTKTLTLIKRIISEEYFLINVPHYPGTPYIPKLRYIIVYIMYLLYKLCYPGLKKNIYLSIEIFMTTHHFHEFCFCFQTMHSINTKLNCINKLKMYTVS